MATAEADVPVIWRAHRGPQERFLAASEFELLYGGAKGGGKSDALIVRPLRQVHKAAFKALILRETYPELEELIRRAHKLYPRLPEKPAWNAEHKRWDFPNPDNRFGGGGASIKFGYCQRLKHVERYQGGEWAEINFDELGNVADERIWTDLLKEVRCPDPTVHRSAAGSANPGFAGHGWIKRRWVKPCGKQGERVHVFRMDLPGGLELRQTRRYIPARIADNPVYARDPVYLATLWSLPKARREQLLDGNWDSGLGLALPELEESVHIIAPFEPPPHWKRIGGFDWGFAHWWVFIVAAISEDGDIFIVDTVKGRRELPDVIARAMKGATDVKRLIYVSGGLDAWHVHRARGENSPTIAEHITGAGIPLTRANTDPVHGLNNLRLYSAWMERGPLGEDGKPQDGEPALYFMDTPGNRWLFEQCEAQITDPDNPERVLKADADPETGEGGDDGFQALQYLVASRPPRGPSVSPADWFGGWDPETLASEALESRKVRSKPAVLPARINPTVIEHIE